MILIIIFIILLSYLLLIGSLVYGFDKVKENNVQDIEAKVKFSIVIPFRNEVEYLPDLLKSIAQLNYPKHLFEILLVDDESSDGSVETIERILSGKLFNTKKYNIVILPNVRLTNSPKKDAITLALQHAKNDWIVTTDADCKLPKYWLDVFDSHIQNTNSSLLIAPVTLDKVQSFFERFQLLDILSLQGATIGGVGIKKPFLCNGANLAYKRTVFESVNGFDGNSDIASGDDIFLLEKVLKLDKSKVHYIKHEQSIIKTKPQPNFKSLKAQRVRWAAKTSSYKNRFGKLTGLIVLLMNALLVCLPLLYVIQIVSLKTLIYIVAIKCLIDFLLVFKTARFFDQESYLTSFFFSSLLYPFFSVYIAFISLFTGYKWKGRSYTK